MTSIARPHVAAANDRLDALIASRREAGVLKLPRETELSLELGISRNTLREALARLEAGGVIERRRRLGTFITPTALPTPGVSSEMLEYPIDEIVSIAAFLEGAGAPFTIRSVAVSQEIAAAPISESLRLDPGASVYRVRRVYDSDGIGIAIGEHLIPTVLRGHEVKIEALTYGVSNFLNETEHIPVDVVEHTVTPLAADSAIAQEFQLTIGAPVLAVEAKLQTFASGRLSVVALGRLIFNPARVVVRASGRQSPER